MVEMDQSYNFGKVLFNVDVKKEKKISKIIKVIARELVGEQKFNNKKGRYEI